MLHAQVGAELDRPDHPATAVEIAEWLGRCTMSWRLSDDPRELKAQLVAGVNLRSRLHGCPNPCARDR